MTISGREIALIMADNYDASEFSGLHNCLTKAGALVSVVGKSADQQIRDWDKKSELTVEVSFEEARSYNFEAAIISGRYSPGEIRMHEIALDFIKSLYNDGKVIGAIDHGAQVLITLGILTGKNATGWPSIRVDLENAGAHYVDEPVAIDENLVTARGPEDVQEFCDAIIDEISRSAEAA